MDKEEKLIVDAKDVALVFAALAFCLVMGFGYNIWLALSAVIIIYSVFEGFRLAIKSWKN